MTPKMTPKMTLKIAVKMIGKSTATINRELREINKVIKCQ